MQCSVLVIGAETWHQYLTSPSNAHVVQVTEPYIHCKSTVRPTKIQPSVYDHYTNNLRMRHVRQHLNKGKLRVQQPIVDYK